MYKSGKHAPGSFDAGAESDEGRRTGRESDRHSREVEDPKEDDVPTEDIWSPYKYNVAKLKPKDTDWFPKKIKIFDKPDERRDATDLSQQQIPTDAFGLLDFEGEDSKGALPSWFLRLAHDTKQEVLLELLETKLEVTNTKSVPIRIHCIDYDNAPSTFDSFEGGIQYLNDITSKLKEDLYSMCRKTDGIILTWSGQGRDNILHHVMREIMKKAPSVTNLASIATPLWMDLDSEVQDLMIEVKGGELHLPKPASPETESQDSHQESQDPHQESQDPHQESQDPHQESQDSHQESQDPHQESRAKLGKEISQYASHFFCLDVELTTQSQTPRNIRHFHKEMIQAMESSESKRKKNKTPVVCLLINGYRDALKMVVSALENRIPVIVVMGSGGYADIIAEVYLKADPTPVKYRDESGQVRTRITKKAGEKGRSYMQNDKYKHPSLCQIFDKLDLLTVYMPAHSAAQTLDSVIFEALMKNNLQAQFGALAEEMQKIKKRRWKNRTEFGCFIDSDEMQMDAFIQALKQNCLDLVKTFLGLDFEGKLKRHLHMGRLLRLYRQLQNTGKQEKLTHYRQKFADWLGTLTVLPLRCVGKGCPSCDVTASTRSTEPGQVVQRTCLHPIQELFLWALHDRRLEMAIVFWERCEDKIAAALVAWRVFISMAKDYSDPDIKWQLEENVRQFQDLAIQTLKSCHNMDELETELLLTKPCPWWGNNSVLQLAIMTENKEFMAQTACTNIMTLIWKGHPLKRKQNPSSVSEEKRPCQLVDTAADMGRWNRCSPFLQYCFNFIMQLLFLGLFSYGLLFDLGHGLTWIFISLIVCVAAITAEEIRQLVSKHAVLRDRSLHMSDNTQITRTKLQTYLSQGWNRVDVTTIVLFWLGLIVFIPVEECQEVGRLLLSIDIFVFFVRTIQMLMVFEELGLMLVMVHKMVKDTINFMIILLIFVLAYAVASESLLYPRSNFTADRLFHLPRKAYWQVFGELNLEEIEIRDNDSCSDSKSKHYGYDEPHCPTKYSTYFVPVLLGIHVMITNVLLLNLLIARFGVTFNKVHEEARQHQSWHRCQIIMEYYNRTAFPPPLNILAIMLSFLTRCCLLVKDCILRLWCCCKQGGRCRRSRRADENLPLLSSSLEAWRSADRRSVKITWTNRLTLAESGGQGAENGQLKQYTVEVNDTDQQECFSVARIQSEEEKEQALTVWDLDTEKDYEIYVAGHNVTLESVKATRSPEDLLKTMAFENEEAKYVRHQEDPSKSWLKDLQAQTEKLQQEIDKVARELKEDHGVLRDDIRKTDKRLRSYSKVDTFILNIKDNLEKLSNYILENVQKQKLVAGIKEAKARKGEAENELQKAKEQLSQLRSEKEAMAREFLDTTKAFEKRQRELENTVWQRLKEGQEEVKRSILLQRDVMMQALQQVLVEVRGGTGYPVPETGGDLGCGQ